MREELLSPDRDPEVDEVEGGLRPRRLAEFVGQAELKGHLRVMLEAARRRDRRRACVRGRAGTPGGAPGPEDTILQEDTITRSPKV